MYDEHAMLWDGRTQRPYLLDVFFSQGEPLNITFMKTHVDDETHTIRIDNYHAGDDVRIRGAIAPQEYAFLKSYFYHAFIEGNGKPHSLVVVSTDLPRRDIVVDGFHLSYHGAQSAEYRARPIWLFIQGAP